MKDDRTPNKKGSEPSKKSAGDYDIQAQYLSEIGRYQLLTPREELDLARRISEGDEEARRKLIISNLRLVVTIAKRYGSRAQPLLDRIEDGNIGLIKAAGKFDYRKGFRFSTYASWWIKQAITRGMANQSRTIRVPVHIYQLINRFMRVEEKLAGKSANDEEMAELLDVSVRKVKLIRNLITGIRSDEPLISAEALQKLASDQYYRRMKTPDEIVMLQMENEHMSDLMQKHLSEREQTILALRYGLDDDEPHTLAQAGEIIGVSRERIRQIEKRALQKLNLMLSGPRREGGNGSD